MLQKIRLPWPQEFIGKWVPIQSTALHKLPHEHYDIAISIFQGSGIMCFDDEEHFKVFTEEENLKRKGRSQPKLWQDRIAQITSDYPALEMRIYVCGRNKDEIAKNLPRVKDENS